MLSALIENTGQLLTFMKVKLSRQLEKFHKNLQQDNGTQEAAILSYYCRLSKKTAADPVRMLFKEAFTMK